MSHHCCHSHDPHAHGGGPGFRRALWIALLVNAAMFAVEIGAGLHSGSVALLADAIDFGGDAANYGISLAVLSMSLAWRARAAWIKGLTMGLFGVFIIGRAGWAAAYGITPEPLTMGLVGLLALAANIAVAWLLYAWRDGDANMRSVWLCSRNDAIGNLAVLLASMGVFGTGSRWPDLVVALVMASLAISAGWSVLRQAGAELRSVAARPA
ncbi:MAG: cation transporter [Gemmatimonadales bacterium]|nr:cation transporter [Gemmatimonadales bacterium]